MRTGAVTAGAVVVLVVAGLTLGGGGAASDGNDVGSFPTETPTGTASADGSGTNTVTPEPTPAFAFAIDRIEECGRPCRDVTSTLTNDGADATDVTVYTRIYVGNGSDGNVIWEGKERVGNLGAGESYTATERVELSLADAIAVESAGGWITVQTTVQSDETTVTFTQRRQVGYASSFFTRVERVTKVAVSVRTTAKAAAISCVGERCVIVPSTIRWPGRRVWWGVPRRGTK